MGVSEGSITGKREQRLRLSRLLFSLATCAAFSLFEATLAEPSYYHDLATNRQPCSDCHTLHYSVRGAQPAGTEAGGPFPQLLVRSTTNKLCLFCHDGSDPKVPDVLAPVTMYDGSGDEHSGAGYFANSGGTANPNGHSLGMSFATVPFSTKTNVTLTCASCHDPHGTPNYRNVLTAPAGGTGVTAEMDKDVFRDQPPGDPPSTAGSVAAYRKSNEGYKAQTSKWCVECHDQLKPNVGGATRTVDHHLADVPINGAGFSTDPAHWLDGTGSGFGTLTGDAVEGIPRLSFQAAGATDFVSSQTVASGNQVICTSCHLAHGWRYQKGLVWPYLESGGPVDANSGCQQCHNY